MGDTKDFPRSLLGPLAGAVIAGGSGGGGSAGGDLRRQHHYLADPIFAAWLRGHSA